ncbi:hypothetical protein [Nostoc sp.]
MPRNPGYSAIASLLSKFVRPSRSGLTQLSQAMVRRSRTERQTTRQ